MPDELVLAYEGRLTEDYLVNQVNGYRGQTSHTDHKREIQDFDDAYDGNLQKLFPDETGLPDTPLVENRLKNATHDIARLASEAQGTPIFAKQKEGKKGSEEAQVRGVIAQTLWHEMRGRRMERKFYMDAIATGYMAAAVFHNKKSVYPQLMRLDPRFCYPDYRNGQLQNMLYVENIKQREAAFMFPDLGLDANVGQKKEVLLVTLYTDTEVCIAVMDKTGGGNAKSAHVVSRWEHKLECVPVAFEAFDTADSKYHGLFVQLRGPLMARNKSVRLLLDWIESMAHAPFEEKNVMNADEEPGADVVYHHDPNADESFIRRVEAGAPSGAVFGFMQYLDAQEQGEAIQPPSRVGIVRQSIASGSFVDSTQGTLSSVVLELQDMMTSLRGQINYVAFKVDAKYLNKEKPLVRAIGSKHAYKPSEDMGDWYYHSVQYGAGAGVSRAEAANRVQLDLGAGLISKETARGQIEYIDDVTVEQDRIDRENIGNTFFQRMSTDPNTPMSVIAQTFIEMGKGKSLMTVLEKIAPQFVEAEEKAAQPDQKEGMNPIQDAENPEEAAAQLEAGGQLDIGGFQAPPLQQQIVRNLGQ